jgi:copper chaperone CopZ
MQKNIFNISGMTCPACVKLVEKRLQKIAEVDSINVNINGKVEIISNTEITKKAVEEVLADSEFKIK